MSNLKIVYEDIAPDAMAASTPSITDLQAFCDPADLTLSAITVPQVATLEDGYWILGTDFQLFPDSPAGQTWGIWSQSQSGADGAFTTPPTLTLLFSTYVSSVGVTLEFDPYGPTWCKDLTITWLHDSTVLATESYTPDAYQYSCIKTVKNYNQLQIQFNSMSVAYRYLKLQRVILGIIRTFAKNEYYSLNMHQAASPISDKLEASTMEVVLRNTSDIAFMFQRKQPLKVKDGTDLLGVYYINTSKKTGANTYSVSNSDLLMILKEMGKHMGGVYSGVLAEDLVEDILGGLKFELDASFVGTSISGFLPVASRPDNLAQVALVLGAIVDTSRSDAICLFPEPTGAAAAAYDAAHAYRGGSIGTTALITSVTVTAHTYTAGTETQQLYNGVLNGTANLIFSTPMSALTITGGTITAWGHNWATITGTGSTVVLTGTKYVHGTQVTTLTNPLVSSGDAEKIKTVSNATLINPSNVAAVAQRIYNHYLRRDTVTKKVVLGSGQPGIRASVDTDFDGTKAGIITALDITGSGTLAADAKILCDYGE